MSNNDFFGDDDLIYNTSSRIPVCLCIDTSASMARVVDDGTVRNTGRQEFRDGKMWNIVEGGICLLDNMVEGINTFYRAIKNHDQARQSCEIAIVTFDDTVRVIDDFTTIDRKKDFTEPQIGDNTMMAAGVKRALELLESRKRDYKKNGVDYYQPWLVLFTDGEPTDNVGSVQQMCREMEQAGKLTVFTFALSEDADKNVLAGFSKRRPLSIKSDKIEEFFEWLGKSVSIVSQSQLGEKVKLDTSTIDDWAEI